jgi:membrane protease YdiL (CAAX protease family)
MMERVRILLVAAPAAPIRDLAPRLQDPDLDLDVCGSAREAFGHLIPPLPTLLVLDGSLPRPDVVRLYGRLRASVIGANVPILFTSHDDASVDLARTTAPDFYIGPDASLEEVEQLIFTFLPDALFEDGANHPLPPAARPSPAREPAAPLQPAPPAPNATSPAQLSWAEISTQLKTASAKIALAYLGVYVLAEVLAGLVDVRLALLVHGGLLLAIFFHGANVPVGPERTFFWTLWLAPLTRVYALAQPFAGAPALTWWALTAVPMAVAGVVSMRLAGLSPRDAGLFPARRDAPFAIVMLPVGLALGLVMHLLLSPRGVGQELPFGGLALVALVAILNPGIVDEIVFRGVLQRGVIGLLGPGLGIVYTGLLYTAIVPAGLLERGSLLAVLLTLGLGLLLSWLTVWTGSVLAATVAHVGLVLGMFVLGPYAAPGGLGLTSGSPSTSSAPDARQPTPRPPIIVVSPQPSPGSPGASPGVPASASPSGSTGITLAPPLPPPQSAPAGAPGSPGAGPAVGQPVVVRNTGGTGARLRSQPGTNGPTIMVVPENTPLLVIGADRTVDGLVWRNVRAPNGNEAWIAADFVGPPQ